MPSAVYSSQDTAWIHFTFIMIWRLNFGNELIVNFEWFDFQACWLLTNGKYIEIFYHYSCYNISCIVFGIMVTGCVISNWFAGPFMAVTNSQKLRSCFCALGINVNNCPTRCDYTQFYYISADSSTCFGWYPHPSSGALLKL